ncbi:MAG TPA: acetylornithine transaminase [Myxococcaceae bacterium]|nr:acetylornithine transaminase [Myxococcaceae bacterium]
MTTQETIAHAKAKLLQNYKQQPVVLVRGEGVHVWDSDGRRYLDLLGGIATCGLGHCHPKAVAAAKAQLETLWHTSNVFYTEPQIELAARLTEASGMDRAFFCNSGAEANEALIKLARRYQKDRQQPGRYEIITFLNSFHGRTLATLTATGQPKYQAGFEPLPAGFVHVPYGDLKAVEGAVSDRTAAILVEPIQGEGGVRVAPAGFLAALRKLCNTHGLLLLVDEVQTGMGRTGSFLAQSLDGVTADAISLAKALGNGLPIGAMLCMEAVSTSLPVGTHGSTFGGNPVAAAAANAVMEVVSAPEFLKEVAAKGSAFREGALAIKSRHPQRVVDVRGRGLLMGVELSSEAAPVVARCREGGMLCNLAGEKVVRFAPPLIATREELAEGLAVLEKALV